MGVVSSATPFSAIPGDPSDNPSLSSRFSAIEDSVSSMAMITAIENNRAVSDLIDGFHDIFEDETGIDTSTLSYNASSEYYTNTSANPYSILIQSETTNGSTTFTDTVGTHTVTANGDVQHSTAQAKFGSSSIIFDGTGDYLSVSDHADFDLDGSSAFTIEAQIYPTSLAANQEIVSKWDSAGGQESYLVRVTTGGEIAFLRSTSGTGGGAFLTTSGAGITINNWYHVAVVYDTTDLKIYVNGTERATTASALTIYQGTASFGVGAVNIDVTPAEFFTGHMEAVAVAPSAIIPPAGGPSSDYSYGNSDGTITSVSSTADSTPTTARVVLFYDDISTTATLNTDVIVEVTSDGATWDTATLSHRNTVLGDKDILTSGDIALTGGGTTMQIRVTTANSKEQRFHGWSLDWR